MSFFFRDSLLKMVHDPGGDDGILPWGERLKAIRWDSMQTYVTV